MSLEIKESLLRSLEASTGVLISKVIDELARKYKFDVEEAQRLFGVSSVSVSVSKVAKKRDQLSKPLVPLPWTGSIKEDWCYGVKPNHGLFSQCTNKPVISKGDGALYGKLCSTCLKQCEKNEHGKPNGGLVTERNDEDYKSPGGKSPVLFSAVMKKLGLERDVVDAECEKFGLTIPESEYVIGESKRGRPQTDRFKKKTGNDVGSPKKRGRPSKAKREVSVSMAEDFLEKLEEQCSAVSKQVEATADERYVEPEEGEVASSSDESVEESVEESGEEMSAVPVMIGKTEYYMYEGEAEEVGCEVMDESGTVMGRYKKKNGVASLVLDNRKMKRVLK